MCADLYYSNCYAQSLNPCLHLDWDVTISGINCLPLYQSAGCWPEHKAEIAKEARVCGTCQGGEIRVLEALQVRNLTRQAGGASFRAVFGKHRDAPDLLPTWCVLERLGEWWVSNNVYAEPRRVFVESKICDANG
jgi:hypothetical protein